MGERVFTALRLEGTTLRTDVALTPLQEARIPEYNKLLDVAHTATPNPWHSLYKVRGSMGSLGSGYIPAENMEYGNGKALHMEEYGVVALNSKEGKYRGQEILMGCVAGEDPKNLSAGSCGNCRDFVGEWMNWQTDRLEMVWGSVDGQRGLVGNYADFTPREFPRVAPNSVPGIRDLVDYALLVRADQFPGDPYSRQNIKPERQYTAVLETDSRFYIAGHTVPVDYHPVNAIARAILRMEDAADISNVSFDRFEDFRIKSLTIAVEGDGSKPPHVMFKDRQDFNNAVWVGGKMTGESLSPEVHLVTYQRDPLVVTGVWETDHRQWLPAPFTPEAFDPGFQRYLANYYA